MSFFLLTLLGLSGSAAGLVAFRQLTWKDSHFHNWLRTKKELARKQRAEEEEKNKQINLLKAEKVKRIQTLVAEQERKAGVSHLHQYVSGTSNHASYPAPTGNSLIPPMSVSGIYAPIRDFRAEIEEEEKRRKYLKKNGSMLGYPPRDYEAELREERKRRAYLTEHGTMYGYGTPIITQTPPQHPESYDNWLKKREIERAEDRFIHRHERHEEEQNLLINTIIASSIMNDNDAKMNVEAIIPESETSSWNSNGGASDSWDSGQSSGASDSYDSGSSDSGSNSDF